MGKKKKKRVTEPISHPIDSGLMKLLLVVTVAYIVVWAVIGSLMGPGFAALFATPIWGISLLLIARWDKNRKPGTTVTLRHLVLMVPLNFWNILFITVSIFVLQQILSGIVFFYLWKARGEFLLSAPNSMWPFLNRMTDDLQATTLFLATTVLAHFGGGFAAAYLPNKKCPSPYLHASVGSILWSLVSLGVLMPLMTATADVDAPSQPEASLALLGAIPALGLALLGVWLAIGTRTEIEPPTEKVIRHGLIPNRPTGANIVKGRQRRTRLNSRSTANNQHVNQSGTREHEPKDSVHTEVPSRPSQTKRSWTRRRTFVLIASTLPLSLVAILIWIYRLPDPVNCSNPPEVASLNYWPVTYTSPAETCHDYPLIQARFADGDYARTREDWERGLTAQVGNEIYVLIYINNGAASGAENINPGRGIATNVRLKLRSSPRAAESIGSKRS
jgi:hypothetical protein